MSSPPCTNVKPPCTNVKPPYWRLSGDGSGLNFVINCVKPLLRCGTHFHIIGQIGLTLVLVEKRSEKRNVSDKCLPHFICIVSSLYQCFSRCTKHIGTFLWISFSNNVMCSSLLDRLLLRHPKNSMHWWAMGYKVCSSLLEQNCRLHWSVLRPLPSLKTKLIVCGSKERRDAR